MILPGTTKPYATQLGLGPPSGLPGPGNFYRTPDEGMWASIETTLIIINVNYSEWLTSFRGRFIPGKERRYPLSRKLGGPQRLSGRCELKKKISLACQNLNTSPPSS